MACIIDSDLTRRQFLTYTGIAAASSFFGIESADASSLRYSQLTREQQLKIDELCLRLDKEGHDIRPLISHDDFQYSSRVEKLFTRNPEKQADKGKRDYQWYRKVVGIENKIEKAPHFLAAHYSELKHAEEKYGVDKKFIVGILGIESEYGRHKGSHKAVNSLVTQYVVGREKFAARELKALLEFAEKTKSHVFDYWSSYAGAIGYAQFIPSSLNRLFSGKNGNGGNPMDMADCIHSIANYLSKAGWQQGSDCEKGSGNWKAVRAYNHSDIYVQAVREIALSLNLKTSAVSKHQ